MFFNILNEGILVYNLEDQSYHINNTLKKLLQITEEEEIISTVMALKNELSL
jgi:hypothetical protein